ncbi:MAG: toxin-antitoxin system HicB family antitoxin [Coriobacteriia bacterium]|nr:toxin-antitoxin system HicB family antitoxin [Coriobacteriia bacterium]
MSNTISLRIPSSYHRAIQKLAKEEKVSMNQIIASAVGEKLSALQTEDYLGARASRASQRRFEAALAEVPGIEPEIHDKMPD